MSDQTERDIECSKLLLAAIFKPELFRQYLDEGKKAILIPDPYPTMGRVEISWEILT